MALTTLDKKPVDTARTPWPPEITAEFERERKSPNGCVGQKLVSENERARVWHIRLQPGERLLDAAGIPGLQRFVTTREVGS